MDLEGQLLIARAHYVYYIPYTS